MSAPVLAQKRCTACGETKPLSAFSRNRKHPDGRQYRCRDCDSERHRTYNDRRRQTLGDEEYRRRNAETVRAHRQRTGDARGKLSRSAYDAATSALRDLHRDDFEALLARERYERGLP